MILDEKDAPASIIENQLFQQIKAILTVNKSHGQISGIQSPLFYSPYSIEHENHIFNQFHMIAKQNQFLQQIKYEISKKKTTLDRQILFCPNTSDLLPIESSFDMSSISAVQPQDDQPFKTKFGQEFQKSLLAAALDQVQQNCSSQTYEAIRNCALNNKLKQFENLSQKHQKLTRKHEQLQTSFIIKSTQLAQTQMQLKEAVQKIDQFDEQKKKLKIKSNQLSQKQKRIYKLETAMVFKEKLFHEGKKRYEREKNLFISIEDRLNKLYKQMQNIWQNICQKMEESSKVGCFLTNIQGGSCWKKQVMRKCKQQLVDQRDLLKQEEQQIQRQFQTIQLLSDQVRKMINDKESTRFDVLMTDRSSICLESK